MKILFYRHDADAQPSVTLRSETAEATVVQLSRGTFVLWLDGDQQSYLEEKLRAILIDAWGGHAEDNGNRAAR